ncbi:hypothetical protein ACFL3V_01605 [Nanoarchaeota archaeon]
MLFNGKELKKEEYLSINSEFTKNGITVSVKGKKYNIEYPEEIWKQYPARNKKVLLDNIPFMQTCHLPASHKLKGAVYNTGMPLFETFAFEGTMYDAPSTAVIDHEKTVDYLRGFFNTEFSFGSYDIAYPRNRRKTKWIKNGRAAIIPFTAGKESLLTFALCLELGIKPILVYIDEDPDGPESKHKYAIIDSIEKEYGIKVYKVVNSSGKLRYCDLGEVENNWGAGTQFLSYILLLMPFARHFGAEHILFGNEYSCDEFNYDKEGFKSNFCYDQCTDWTKQLNAVTKIMTKDSVEVGSLVGPLYELGLTKILHQRYPHLASLQMSCFSDTEPGKKHVWCGHCSKCARLFAFFKALGIDTSSLGFAVNMFNKPSREFFSLFGTGSNYSFDISGLGKEEQALAFYLAAEHGETGYLVDKFKKTKAYREVRDNIEVLQMKYFSCHDSITLPEVFRKRVVHVFEQTFRGDFWPKDFRVKQGR